MGLTVWELIYLKTNLINLWKNSHSVKKCHHVSPYPENIYEVTRGFNKQSKQGIHLLKGIKMFYEPDKFYPCISNRWEENPEEWRFLLIETLDGLILLRLRSGSIISSMKTLGTRGWDRRTKGLIVPGSK